MLRLPFPRRMLPGAFLAVLGAGCAGPPPQVPGPAESLARIAADRILDLSYQFDEGTIYWPTVPRFHLTNDFAGTTEAGFFYASNSMCASEHGGTHLDAPYHFYEAGRTTDGIPPRALIGRACVIDARAACAAERDHAIGVDEIRSYEATNGPIPEGAIAILFTGWGKRWPDRKLYLGDDTPGDASRLHFPGLSPEAASYLAGERRVAGVGIDTASIDPGNSKDFKAHRILAAANVYNLENLAAVDRLPQKGATLIALPMKIAGGTGGPVRVVAILP